MEAYFDKVYIFIMCLTRSLKFFCLKCNSTSQLPWESPKSSNSVFQSFNKYFSGQDLLPQTLSEHSKFPTVPLCRNLKDSFTGVSGSRSCRHLWQPQPFHLLLLNSPLPKIIKVWFGFPLPTLPFIFQHAYVLGPLFICGLTLWLIIWPQLKVYLSC